jgi:hypothetical protein
MKGVWQKLTPQFVVDFKGYEQFDEEVVEEFLEFHAEEVTANELVQLGMQRQSVKDDDDEDPKDQPIKQLDTASIKEFMGHADAMKNIILEHGGDIVRSIFKRTA